MNVYGVPKCLLGLPLKKDMLTRHVGTRYVYAFLVGIAAIAAIAYASAGAIGDKDIAGALLALLGTFLGALFAFRLNEDKDRKLLLKEQKASLNRALFVLLRQYNAVCAYQKYLDSFTTPIERAFNLPANKPPDYSGLVHEFSALEFLLESPHANVLMKLTVEQESFQQALECIRIRNEFYVQEVQPGLARLQIQGKFVSAEQLQVGLGERVFGAAMTGIREVYDHIPASVASLKAMHEELFAVAKELFPSEKFIKPAEA